MLGIGAGAAPGDRRGWQRHRAAITRDRLAIRFHLQLLQIGRKQAEAFVIGKDRPAIPAVQRMTDNIKEGCQYRGVGEELGLGKMPVHHGGAGQQLLERCRAVRQCGGEPDARP